MIGGAPRVCSLELSVCDKSKESTSCGSEMPVLRAFPHSPVLSTPTFAASGLIGDFYVFQLTLEYSSM